jgi:rhamnosyltransferase
MIDWTRDDKGKVSCYQVAAYITVYEDLHAVQQCLRGIERQTYPVKEVIIVDNSAENPLQLSALATKLPIVLKAFPQNLGVAGGLRVALKWAFDQGYDFLWTFDQDSIPAPDCLEKLLEIYQTFHSKSYPLGIVAPTALDVRTQTTITAANFEKDQFIGYHPVNPTTCYECDAPITSGSLISLVAAQRVFSTSPIASLVIDGVDLEYGMTLKKKGYHHLIITQAKLYHCFGNPLTIQWLGREKKIYQYSPVRHYYICRNYTYLALRYSRGKHWFSALRRRFNYLIKTSIVIYLFDPQEKFMKIQACWLGTFEGLLSKWRKSEKK